MGRHSTCTPEIVEAICGAIADKSSLAKACGQNGVLPSTFLGWCNADPAIDEQYARAREARGMAHGDQVDEIVRDVLTGSLDPAAARVAIDGLKWMAARMAPKRLGDKVQQEISGPGGKPIEAVTRIEIVAGGNSSD